MLDYKTLGGDVLIFKGKNTMTISRGALGFAWIDRIEVDGENVDIFNDDEEHPFTEEEIKYFVDNYDSIVGDKY